MRRARRLLLGLLIIGSVGSLSPAARAAGAPRPETITCGEPIDHSITVTNDLFECPGDGIVSAADGIVIDLAGHEIGGKGSGTGFNNTNSHVTLKNGTITGFYQGIVLGGGLGNVVRNVHSTSNGYDGLVLVGSSDVIRDSTFTENGFHGVTICGDSNRLTRNSATLNTHIGYWLDCSGSSLSANNNSFTSNIADDNGSNGIQINGDVNNPVRGTKLRLNKASANGYSGISLEGSLDNTVSHNTASSNTKSGIAGTGGITGALTYNRTTGNTERGIYVSASSDLHVIGNTVARNGEDGMLFDAGSNNNVVRYNKSSGNALAGISVTNSSTGNTVTSNSAVHNGFHGIFSDTSDLTIKRNRTNNNGFFAGTADGTGLGIDVPAGTINSANRAAHNDDPHQCQASDVNCYRA